MALPDRRTWAERYEQAGPIERIALLGGAAVRAVANGIDRAIDRAAGTVAEAEEAFRKEVDPNITDARIVDETEERGRRDG